MNTKLISTMKWHRLFPLMALVVIFLALTFANCSKDSKSSLKGSWKMEFSGAISGSMPLNISKLPEESTMKLSVTLDGKTINYDLELVLGESGELAITVLDQHIEAGYMSGSLQESGNGEGVYQILFEKDGNIIPLNGDWSATKN